MQQTEPALLEPEAKKSSAPIRCIKPPGALPSTLRALAEGDKNPVPVDVGMGIGVNGGFAVSGLTSGGETHAFVFFTNGRGREKKIDLGRVHGAVEPPLLANYGPHLLVAVIDNDAMNTRIRLAKISNISGTSEVTWGPESQAARDESTSVSLTHVTGSQPARALLVWDDFERARSRSRIQGLWFSPDSMAAEALPQTISQPDQDVVEPRLLARSSGGAWLTWLAYGKMSGDLGPRVADAPLVSEPPRWLEVRKLGSNDKKWGESLRVSSESGRVLTYDIGAQGERLIVASRGESAGDTFEFTPVDLRLIALDGSVQRGSLQEREIGPGAPLILSGTPADAAWLTAKGHDQELLWGSFDVAGTITDFREEAALEGAIPLARVGNEMLLVKPTGLDLELSSWLCNQEKPPAAPASPQSR